MRPIEPFKNIAVILVSVSIHFSMLCLNWLGSLAPSSLSLTLRNFLFYAHFNLFTSYFFTGWGSESEEE